MQTFTRMLILSGLGLLLVVTYLASRNGYGLSRLTDPRIQQAADKEGSGFRYFHGRSIRGGGPRYGK